MGCGYRAAMAGGMADDQERWTRPPLFRSGWEIAAMVGGFVVFFPVGLAILGYLLWRKKFGDGSPGEAKSEFKRWKQEMKAQWRDGRGSGSSGNFAFDDYRTEVLRRLEDERRRLDEEQKAFREFLLRLRRAKDQEEFDRFMAERNGSQGVQPTA
jgi:hypothetical protein